MPPKEKRPRWQDFNGNNPVLIPHFGVPAYRKDNGKIYYDRGYGEEPANIVLSNGAIIDGKIFKWRKGKVMLSNIQMYGKC